MSNALPGKSGVLLNRNWDYNEILAEYSKPLICSKIGPSLKGAKTITASCPITSELVRTLLSELVRSAVSDLVRMLSELVRWHFTANFCRKKR